VTITVRRPTDADRPSVEAILRASWGELRVAASGRLYDLATLPTLIATDEAGIVGILTYEIVGDQIEVVSIDATDRYHGVGTTLLEAAANVGVEGKLRTLWLVTTNDNLDALRFYQRRGLRIARVDVDGVARSRRLKPSIPMIGAYGIPIRDEIILARSLPSGVEL
jgi:ribosomal protein S18 acetylase RimI-like enzyme